MSRSREDERANAAQSQGSTNQPSGDPEPPGTKLPKTISNITERHAEFFTKTPPSDKGSNQSGLSMQSDDSEADTATPSGPSRGHPQPLNDAFIHFWLHVSSFHATRSSMTCQDVVLGPLQGGGLGVSTIPAPTTILESASGASPCWTMTFVNSTLLNHY